MKLHYHGTFINIAATVSDAKALRSSSSIAHQLYSPSMHHCQIYELLLCHRLTDISHDPLLWAGILLICFNESKTTNVDLTSGNEMRKLMYFSPLNSQGKNLWVILNPLPGWSNTHTHTHTHTAPAGGSWTQRADQVIGTLHVVVEERPPPMIVKRFGCTTIHNKALYKCLIHSFINLCLQQFCMCRMSFTMRQRASVLAF